MPAAWLYTLVLRIAAISLLQCVLHFLLPAGALRRSAGRALDLILFWMVAEAVFSALGEVL